MYIPLPNLVLGIVCCPVIRVSFEKATGLGTLASNVAGHGRCIDGLVFL